MAVDEAVLEAVGRGASLPTLRLYAWEPACLSVGYAQKIEEVDFNRLRTLGWDFVRRPTGGRAVLHVDELTYAVIAPPDEPQVAGTVLESYHRLAQALVEALRLLSLPVEVKEQAGTPGKSPNPGCLDVPSSYEITVGGKKLIGSAQARRKDGVLQHGSLPLTGDLGRILQVLAFPDEASRLRAADRLLERATTVETALGRAVTWDAAAEAFRTAFGKVLALHLENVDLSPTEKERAGELVTAKYAHDSWNQKS